MKPLRIHFHRPRLTRKLVLRLVIVMVPLVWLYTTHVIPPVFEIIDKNEFLAKFQTTPAMRAEVVENLARQMEQHYVDAARGKKAAYRIRYKLQKGGYDELLNQRNFTDELHEIAVASGHCTSEAVTRVAKQANAKHLVLTHFNPRSNNDPAEEDSLRKEFPHAIFAADKLVVTV